MRLTEGVVRWLGWTVLFQCFALLVRDRSRRDGCRFTDRTGGRHDADARMYGDIGAGAARCEARALPDEHYLQLHHTQGSGHQLACTSRAKLPDKDNRRRRCGGRIRGSGQVLEAVASTEGTIDRITGDLEFTEMSADPKTVKVISQTNFALKCKPAQRMFRWRPGAL
jgi:hypothetical protein